MTKSSLSIPRPPDKAGLRGSVSPEQIAGVDLLLYIIEAAVIAVGNNGLTPLFERLKVVYHLAAKEGRAVLQRRLVDDDGRALGLDPLHDALNVISRAFLGASGARGIRRGRSPCPDALLRVGDDGLNYGSIGALMGEIE